jgi:uncharacterized membrane protein YgcG
MRGARLRAPVQRALLASWIVLLVSAAAVAGVTPPGTPPPGPPYPPPVNDVVVYDYADIFTSETEASATTTIVAIEQRVKAEIVVYSQLKPGSTESSTESDAASLIDQYGVGREGFDDGVAILFNMNRSSCQPGVSGNGQVQLFAGPGYRATFLSDGERQAIFDNDMLPRLRECDMDGALLVALEKIDANANAGHARSLELARIADAAMGLIGAPVVFMLLVGIAARSWLRYGRDPVYLDSPSILMPAPPPDLTAASGALVWEGKTTRRALTTALLDLASRGEISFRTEDKLLGRDKAGVQVGAGAHEPDPHVVRNRRRPLSGAENFALAKLHSLAAKGSDNYIDADEIVGFAASVPAFTAQLEAHVARHGWFREPPAKAVSRWGTRGGILFVLGIVAFAGATSLPSGGLTLLAVALIAAGAVITLIARIMPARTMAGAMIYAMLAAYRRTLQKTMAQARSMKQVVDQAELEWLETPDQAVVWGVALGLHREVEDVLARSVEDAQAGVTDQSPWVPAWYGSRGSIGSGSGGSGGIAPGLFSSSAMPSFGGMMAALGSIGSAPSSSGGSGGFGGGSSGGGGGGGGGAGGGF